MKSIKSLSCGAAAALALLACLSSTSSTAFGSQVTISQVSGYSAGSGGEFLLVPDADLAYLLSGYDASATYGSGFFSFCLEKNEYFYPGSTYNAAISAGSIGGGLTGAVDGTDIISNGTAWLYQKFATGALTGYDYDPIGGRSTAAELQEAFWYLEGENASIGANQFVSLVTTQFGSLVGAVADNDGSFGVKVINLGDSPSYPNQDQLVYTPSVPDNGATVALLGLGMLGLFMVKRRMATVS